MINKKILFLFPLLIIAIIGGVFLYSNRKTDYIIPGVTPITMYTENIGHFPNMHDSRVAAVEMILGYWGDHVNFDDIKKHANIKTFFTNLPVESRSVLRKEFFGNQGYISNVLTLRTPKELKQYINPQTRTPLLLVAPLSPQTSTIPEAWILIGIKERSQTYVFHQFYLGNNIELTFDEFDKLWATSPYASIRNEYVVIWPQNKEERLAKLRNEPSVPYSPLPQVAQAIRTLLPQYLKVNAEANIAAPERVQSFYTVMKSAEFAKLHPLYQIALYARYAQRGITYKHFDEAFSNLEKAEALNHDLNKAYDTWPAIYRVEKVSWPYEAYSLYYQTMGDTKKSDEYAVLARNIMDESRAAVGLAPCATDCDTFIHSDNLK